MLPDLIKIAREKDIIRVHYAIIGIKTINSVAHPPIQHIIDSGIVPFLIQQAKQHEYPQLQMEAAWILTNVASGTTEQCTYLVDRGMTSTFVELTRASNLKVVEQGVWALGCIAGDNHMFRDQIIEEGGIESLLSVL